MTQPAKPELKIEDWKLNIYGSPSADLFFIPPALKQLKSD